MLTLFWVFNVCNISPNFETEFRHSVQLYWYCDFLLFALLMSICVTFSKFAQKFNNIRLKFYIFFFSVDDCLCCLFQESAVNKSLTICGGLKLTFNIWLMNVNVTFDKFINTILSIKMSHLMSVCVTFKTSYLLMSVCVTFDKFTLSTCSSRAKVEQYNFER